MLSVAVRLALAVLATYRLAQLIYIDDGPFLVFGHLRGWAKDIYSHSQTPGDIYWSIYNLITCPYCLGVWFGMLTGVLVLWPTIYGDVFLLILGIAGGQTWLQGRGEK